MKSTSIIAAALLSALTLPVFAQTGAAATPATAPKAEHAVKHKVAKPTVKKAGKEKTNEAGAEKPGTDSVPAKAK